jgi:hypothetical protein
MSNRNPSFGLTDKHVDDIADRLLLGKYEKHRPIQHLEVVRAGFLNAEHCRSYVLSRWGERDRWNRGPRGKDGPLSPAGVTMRTNKLWERCSDHVRAVKNGNIECDELVWKITDNRTYETVCYATGSAQSARQWAFTLFGWTLREGMRVEDLRSDLAGCGGPVAASIANIGMIGRLNDAIDAHEGRAARELAAAEKTRLLRDTIASASAHLTG